MGQPILMAFGVLAALGAIMLGFGLIRGARTIGVLGAAVLLAATGAWVFGVPGIAAGLIALAFLKRGSTPS
jgi:hypothetical protein